MVGLLPVEEEIRDQRAPALSTPPCRTLQEGSLLEARKRVLTRAQLCWHADLRLPNLQSCDK